MLILGKIPTDGVDGTTLTAGKEYSINFTEQQRADSYVFVNGIEIYKFKAKDCEINAALLCLGNVSKKFSVESMNKSELYKYAYDFSVDILDVHKYLMKKHDLK